MPAAAVIPAPIAYVIVAVVEKLVVGFRLQTRTFFTKRTFSCDFSIRVNVGWITRLQNTKLEVGQKGWLIRFFFSCVKSKWIIPSQIGRMSTSLFTVSKLECFKQSK